MSAETVLLIAVLALAGYGAFDLARRVLEFRRKRKLASDREQADEEEYWTYEKEHRAIRHRFDPEQAWNEATLLPDAYVREIRELNMRHRAMLRRRNGWTDEDLREEA